MAAKITYGSEFRRGRRRAKSSSSASRRFVVSHPTAKAGGLLRQVRGDQPQPGPSKGHRATLSGSRHRRVREPACKWSDGKAITPQDVVFTTNVILKSCTLKDSPYTDGCCGFGGMPPATGSPELVSAEATGPHPVVFTTNTPANPEWFELDALDQIQPMPQSLWDKGSYAADLTLLKKCVQQADRITAQGGFRSLQVRLYGELPVL